MSDSLLLAGDIGNTRIKLAILAPSPAPFTLPECRETFSFPQSEPVPWEQLQGRLSQLPGPLTNCLLSGSQRERLETLVQEWPTDFPEPRVIRSALELPLKLAVDHPDKVGVDRVLNALAVNRLRTEQAPAIIVDAGTAITIDVLSPAGEFLGGAILPGYELEAHALHDYTSLLPFIPMEEIIGEIPAAIGRNTTAALRSGLIWGQVGAVNEIVARMTARFTSETAISPQYYLTGGAAPLLEMHLREHFRSFPQLTLQGLACVAEGEG